MLETASPIFDNSNRISVMLIKSKNPPNKALSVNSFLDLVEGKGSLNSLNLSFRNTEHIRNTQSGGDTFTKVGNPQLIIGRYHQSFLVKKYMKSGMLLRLKLLMIIMQNRKQNYQCKKVRQEVYTEN